MNPKIIILDDQITPYRIPIYKSLAALRSDVRVLFSSRVLTQPAWKIPEALGFDHEILPAAVLRLTRPPYDEPRFILINPTLAWRLLRLRPRLVVGYAFSFPAWVAFSYTRLLRRNYVCWSTDTLHTERLMGPLQRLGRRIIIPRAAACITASRDGAEKFSHYGAPEERIRIVTQRTLVDPTSSEPGKDGEGPVTFLYVGALSRRKGVEKLVLGFRSLCDGTKDVKLLLVGDGPERSHLEELVEKQGLTPWVEFTGFVQPEALGEYYSKADAFVFPSLEDTFGVVVSDAAAAGLPIIASMYAGATSEFLSDGENGFAVDPRDVEQVAERMQRLASSKQLRERMGRTSLALAGQKTSDAAARALNEALELGLQRGPESPGR